MNKRLLVVGIAELIFDLFFLVFTFVFGPTGTFSYQSDIPRHIQELQDIKTLQQYALDIATRLEFAEGISLRFTRILVIFLGISILLRLINIIFLRHLENQ